MPATGLHSPATSSGLDSPAVPATGSGLDSPAEPSQMPATGSGPDSPAELIHSTDACLGSPVPDNLVGHALAHSLAGYSGSPADMDGVVPGCGMCSARCTHRIAPVPAHPAAFGLGNIYIFVGWAKVGSSEEELPSVLLLA